MRFCSLREDRRKLWLIIGRVAVTRAGITRSNVSGVSDHVIGHHPATNLELPARAVTHPAQLHVLHFNTFKSG